MFHKQIKETNQVMKTSMHNSAKAESFEWCCLVRVMDSSQEDLAISTLRMPHCVSRDGDVTLVKLQGHLQEQINRFTVVNSP